MKLNVWLNPEQAKKIPEGTAVIVRRPIDPPSYEKNHLYEFHGWFRPDWIGAKSGYPGHGSEQYMALEFTTHPKKTK